MVRAQQHGNQLRRTAPRGRSETNEIVQQKAGRALVGMWALFYTIILILMQLEVMGI